MKSIRSNSQNVGVTVDFEPLLWAASKENKDDETRRMAKEVIDDLCYIQHI